MRKALTMVGLILALLLALAASVEVTMGAWRSGDPLDRLIIPRDQKIKVTAAGLYPGGGPIVYRRDRWGFRTGAKDPARINILTLGDSTTAQPFLTDAATWQGVMTAAFQAEDKDVVVANAGMDGVTTHGLLAALNVWLPHVPGLKPRFVVVPVGLNDAEMDGAPADELIDPNPARGWAAKSGLLRGWKSLTGRVQGSDSLPGHRPVDFAQVHWTDRPNRPDDKGPTGIKPYQERLRLISERIHDLGGVPVFVTQSRGDMRVVNGRMQGAAASEGANGLDRARHLARINRATLDLCSDEGLLCLDPAHELTFEPGDFYDYVHLGPSGAAKLGKWLHAKLGGLV